MKRYVLITLFLGLMASHAANAEPSAQDPLTEAKPLCDSRHVTEARKFINRRIALLSVALTHADFNHMSAYSYDIESWLLSCVPPASMTKETFQGQICDSECFAKRAEVFLFMVSELPYISNGSKSRLEKVNMEQGVLGGLRIVDQGLLQLSRMNFGSHELPAAPDEKNGGRSESFNNFLRQQARLTAIKARLILAHGDSLYQSISRTRAETLKMRLLGEDVTQQLAGNNGTETYFAAKKYEDASWVIQEALIDLPNTDAFASEYFELSRLKNDTIERLRSIQKGNLFLNIDPEVFTTKKSEDLLQSLAAQLNSIAVLEDRVDDIIKSWEAVKLDEDRRGMENQRIRDTRSIELKSYEIAQLHETAASIQRNFETALSENDLKGRILSKQADILERNNAINRLQLELAKAKKQAETQQDLIKKQAEVDLTSLARDSAREKRDEYRWMIDVNLSNLNLALQIEQLKSEIDSLEQQVKIRRTDSQALDKTIAAHEADIKAHDAKINELNNLIAKFQKSSTEVYQDSRKPLVMGICALIAQKARLKGSADGFSDSDGGGSCPTPSVQVSEEAYWRSLLQMRREFFGEKGEKLTKNISSLRQCLLTAPSAVPGAASGSNPCAAFGSLEKIARETHEKEMAIFEQVEKPKFEERKRILEENLRLLKTAMVGLGVSKGAHTVITSVAGALRTAAAGIRVTTGVAGLGPMLTTEIDLGEKAKSAYDVAMDIWNGMNEIAQMEVNYASEVKALERAKAELEQQLEATIKQYKPGNLKELVMNRTLADITGQDLQLQNETITIMADASKFLIEKDFQMSNLDAEAQRIDAEINKIKRELDRMKSENSLTAFDIKMVQSQIEQEQHQKASLRAAIEGLHIQKKGIDVDIHRLAALVTNAAKRKSMVEKTADEVKDLQAKSNAEQQIIHELMTQLQNKMSLLTASQLKQVVEILESDTESLTAQIKGLAREIASIEEQIETVDKKALDLTASMKAGLDEIASAISVKRQEILALAKKPDSFDQQREMFFASQVVAADLTRGANEYLRAKKEKMHYVNFLYNLYRSRLNTLATLKGKGQQEDLVPYILNYEDLMKAVQNCSQLTDLPFHCSSDSLAFDESPVVVRKADFIMPADSGFMQELLGKGRARFEITHEAMPPGNSAHYEDYIKQNGSFMQWEPLIMRTYYNMSVVNIVLGLEGPGLPDGKDRNCDPKVIVRHLGFGVRYLPLSNAQGEAVPQLAVDAARVDVLSPHLDESMFKTYMNFFTNGDSIPEEFVDPQTRQPRALRYLGAPLVGTYEVALDAMDPLTIKTCFEKRNLRIGFNFTTPFSI
ncbi:hypothetical protein [Oligoflexus tunisiensis]|uniref:hypothetical protein n=1 Tax=Oligoflexus tunisiensis TaxID=708132 RepID=UPI00114D13BA|nr:hypothetical protein [Oligoflexus tunisiensis]